MNQYTIVSCLLGMTKRIGKVAKRGKHLPKVLGLALLLAVVLTPSRARACACGCGVYDVGTSTMLPEGQGGMVWAQYDYQDQNRNWHATSGAPAADNGDKEIETHFITAGFQYLFDRSWGVQVEVPYDNRSFRTTGGASGDDIVSLNWWALGDIRIEGIYTGFSPDLSTGLTFGFKLPSGDYTYNNQYGDADRDSELGTGSLDVLLGGFHRGNLAQDGSLTWFTQALLDVPVEGRQNYIPGTELDTSAGIYYNGLSIGNVKVTPVAQVIGSERTRDDGSEAAHPIASGYQRIMLSPGVEFNFNPMSVYADVEVPVFQDFRGDQLVAPILFKLNVSYHF